MYFSHALIGLGDGAFRLYIVANRDDTEAACSVRLQRQLRRRVSLHTQKTLYGDFHLGVEFLRVKLVDFAVIRNRAKIQGNRDVSDRRNSNVVETAALARECTATEQDRPVEAPVQGGFNDTQESGRGRTGGRR